MKIEFIFVGRTKSSWLVEGEGEFLKRLGKFASVEVKIVKEISKGLPERIKEGEGKSILRSIKDGSFVCLLSSRGKELTSREFAQKISDWELEGSGTITFIVGGSWGVSEEVVRRADFVLSLSKMTFLHEMIRPFLFEQVYRAFAILKDKDYHKGL